MATATVGKGEYTYRAIQDWARLPEGETLGLVSMGACDSQDRVYVFHRRDPPVRIFDRDGNYLSSWGNGAFIMPHGFSIVNDIVYVADDLSHVCLMYTLDGKPIQMLGRHGVHSDTGYTTLWEPVLRAAGPFYRPTKIVPDSKGDLYVTDGYGNARVHRFSPEGYLKFSWGEPGSHPGVKEGRGHFHNPHSLVVHEGLVYVCDRENLRVQIFTTEGEHVDTWLMPRPQDILLGPEGLLYVAGRSQDEKSGWIRVVDLKGNVLVHFECRGGHGMWVDSHGDIYSGLGRHNPASVSEEGRAMGPDFVPPVSYEGAGVIGAVDKFVRVR